ncbi:hypothetical protein L1987_52011 [Smallanthus sonchifolius]|uniref:Uncharacterized protein n=1 Tax=Smallanthus sonchifolius TaxID=185202 RepID=A0ACB9ET28_9ASTR|nr:hypothetical protein L1987_52011 [Smallanthus sonchifolius]
MAFLRTSTPITSTAILLPAMLSKTLKRTSVDLISTPRFLKTWAGMYIHRLTLRNAGTCSCPRHGGNQNQRILIKLPGLYMTAYYASTRMFFFVEDLWGFLYFYGLAVYHSELHTMPSDEDLPDLVTLLAEDAPVFELWTLPVDGKSNRWGWFVDIGTREVLTRKYHIKLRGIRSPEIGTPNGTKARDLLAKLVTDKCLTISVYYIDEKARCVGDVYCGNTFLQKILLKKGAASGCWTRDSPGVEKEPSQ